MIICSELGKGVTSGAGKCLNRVVVKVCAVF